MEVIINDVSPQLEYYTGESSTSGWIVNHGLNTTYPDTYTSSYLKSTFHGTFGDGDRVVYTFNGTEVGVFGGKRPNHGSFGVILDDEAEIVSDGYSEKSIFNQALYTRSGLDPSVEHTITITNRPNDQTSAAAGIDHWLDIDYISTSLPLSEGTQLQTTFIDDTSVIIMYPDTWALFGSGDGGFYNLTDHLTSTIGDEMSFQFTGSSIQLFASVNTDHGNYSVTLDGGDARVYNAENWELIYGTPMFTATGLGEGNHTIKLSNLGGGGGENVFGFDYAVVNSTSSSPSSSAGVSATTKVISSAGENPFTVTEHQSSSASPSPSSSASSSNSTAIVGASSDSSSSSTNVGALAGGIVGGLIALSLLTFLAFWLLRRRRRQQQQHKPRVDSFYAGWAPAPGPPAGEVWPGVYSGGGLGTSEVREARPGNSNTVTHPSMSSYPAPSPPVAGAYARPGTPCSTPSSHQSYPQSPSPSQPQQEDSSPLFFAHVPPPPTSNASSYPLSFYTPSALPTSYAASSRASEEQESLPRGLNRYQQGFGLGGGGGNALRLSEGPDQPDQEGGGRGVLPPDYAQATRPLPGEMPRSGRP
ncbi:hypothetical protein L198_02076 [Cryptococcus wingfieldii CBS 7118]|uniref:Peptidase A1 domain-containing protein n=1 Tax=Cryptococcus wingfieldii CBS 7118 TaxID=1295528 RepID=A0A1E3JX54_9TREE|nr:hypothetical protein L198_02076 [Cryptococcus wingfieldii CBS 7118]ODO05383.1 hypothetical protein L198_02076 [Cryptococcus wingfieldii CBS 7118]